MVPMITVQLYGVYVYSGTGSEEVVAATALTGEQKSLPVALKMLLDLASMIRDVLPIILTILFFQYVVLRRGLANPSKILFGFLLVILGLYAFVVGLKMGQIGRAHV